MLNKILSTFQEGIHVMCYPLNKAFAFADAFAEKHKQKIGGVGITAVGLLLVSGNFADPPLPVWAIVFCSIMPLTVVVYGTLVIAGKEQLQ